MYLVLDTSDLAIYIGGAMKVAERYTSNFHTNTTNMETFKETMLNRLDHYEKLHYT